VLEFPGPHRMESKHKINSSSGKTKIQNKTTKNPMLFEEDGFGKFIALSTE
jgi:hypothetical protein